MEKSILHCDLNNFYASVECKFKPELKKVPMAVGGSVKDRHGIILAKNDLAKKFNVITGEPIWEAEKKCHNLIIVPPNMDEYIKHSNAAKAIYESYTDIIESFGIDECWLDVTGSKLLFGSGEDIAFLIKERIKKELGLTISVGVSFNKIFAKLGSDMKKPDAITVLSKENYKEKIYPLSINELLGIGRNSSKKLQYYGIKTLNDLASTNLDFLRNIFGKQGVVLYQYINGLGDDEVTTSNNAIKSIGNSVTWNRDLYNNNEVFYILYTLSEKICDRMREQNVLTNGITVVYKDTDFKYQERQIKLKSPTRNPLEIAKTAMELFKTNYNWEKNIRAVGIRAIYLINEDLPYQTDLLQDFNKINKLEELEDSIYKIRQKYKRAAIVRATLFKNEIYNNLK